MMSTTDENPLPNHANNIHEPSSSITEDSTTQINQEKNRNVRKRAKEGDDSFEKEHRNASSQQNRAKAENSKYFNSGAYPGQSTTVVNGRTRSKTVLYGDRKWPAYTTTVYGGIRRETDFLYGYRGKIRYVQVSKLKLPYTVANDDRVRPYITAHDRVHL